MTTAPSETMLTDVPEQRLHPLSWLFELFNVLRQFIVPIVILLFTGRGESYELWGLLGAGIMVPLAVARYYSFRYRIGSDRIVIRSGLLHKTVRDIAFTRIQNVTLHQGLLHRLMQVAEVRLETGGGEDKEEGRMRVLGFVEAQRLQRIIRSQDLPADDDGGAPMADERVLLRLPAGELLKLGLISNKGMLLVAAFFGATYQFNWKLPQAVIQEAGGWLMNHRDDLGGGPGGYVLGGMLVLLAAFILLRLISVLQAILHFHGFVLRGDTHRLSIERGLLNRFHGSLPRTRIQAWTLQQGWLQRRFARYHLRVDAAAGGVKSEHMESNWQLAPIADEAHIAGVIESVLPAGTWPVTEWRPLHPKAWLREFKAPALGSTLGLLALAFWDWRIAALLALAAYPLLYWQSRLWAAHAGYSHANGLIAVREGWIGKHWRFAQTHKLQAVYLRQSPFDRRNGMATVFCDTVNAGSFEPPLAVRYLPYAEAVELHRQLSAEIAR